MYKLLFVCCLIGNVVSAQNTAPYALDPKSIQVLPGQTACLNIITNDDDPSDTVRISWNTAVQTATFTHNSGAVQHASGQICWSPTKTDASLIPYYFFILLDDGHVQVTDTFSITVNGIPERDSFRYERTACGERTFYAAFNEWVSAVTYKFVHQGTSMSYSTPVTEVTLGGLTQGTYLLETTVFSVASIYTKYVDTFVVTEGLINGAEFDSLSEPNQFRIKLIDKTGTPNIRYSWILENSLGFSHLPDTLPEIIIQVWETSFLYGIMSYDQNCRDTTVITLFVDPNSVREIKEQALIYPNPCVDQLNIESQKPILSITLFDIQGKQVLQQEEAEALITQLQLSDLPKGTYMLAIRFMDGSMGHHAVVVR